MTLLEHTWTFLTDPVNWSGPDGIPVRLLQHVELSGAGVALGAAVAIPVGLLIGHTRRARFLVVSIANMGRAVPSLAILSVVYQIMLVYIPSIAFGFGPTVVALTLLAVPPILTNTYVGVEQVDADAVDAGRGMGMTGGQVLRRLELPLAVPLIVAGLRTAAVQVVATATLAALIAGGGLGRYIIDGFARQELDRVLAGAILVALLAILTEVVFAGLGRLTAPRLRSQ
jgi:osmoprotectant transport system permease protein